MNHEFAISGIRSPASDKDTKGNPCVIGKFCTCVDFDQMGHLLGVAEAYHYWQRARKHLRGQMGTLCHMVFNHDSKEVAAYAATPL